jgi:glyoxalase family protein
MSQLITGLHHVTALADDAQKNIDFYAGILGMRIVKKTINFDVPEVYHLYYGNEQAAPGSIMTSFPYQGIMRGRKGKGQVTVTSFSVPANSLPYWQERLKRFGVLHNAPAQRFDEEFIYMEDHDGLGIELVASNKDKRPAWQTGPAAAEHSIRGFWGVTLAENSLDKTATLLQEYMDHTLIAEKGNRYRFAANNEPGAFVDIDISPSTPQGLQGGGTVHHVAFATANDDTQLQVQEKLNSKGYQVTQVMDRQYFHSIYFREPGGVLFEVATNPPGFAVDEDHDKLGTALKLPEWQETNREKIEKGLQPVSFDAAKFKD